MGNFMKKNWFICLLTVVFIGVTSFYIYDTNKGKLKGKTDSGKDVIYEVNGENTTADDFYDTLYETGGTSAIYHAFARAVSDTVETTEEMEQNAASQASTIISNYASSYSTDYQSQIASQLTALGYDGYDDLQQYLIDYLKQEQIAAEYARDNFDELKIRSISYLLIQPTYTNEDSETITRTDEEIEEIQAEVDEMIASGATFAEVAAAYSEDSSTASDGGYLGTIDVNTSNLDEAFFNAAMELEEGEISDWVYSENFGYFKIYANATTQESFEADYASRQETETTEDAEAEATASADTTEETTTSEIDPLDPYYDLLSNYDSTLFTVALWDRAEQIGLTFTDPDVETALKTYMGLDTED